MNSLVVATRSPHKLREIQEILQPLVDVHLIDLGQAGVPETAEEDSIERFDSFLENALAKARFFARRTEAPVIADDSGLCVDALDGAPGVRSKRFSGRDDLQGKALDRANNELLLQRLQGVPPRQRSAQFRCIVAVAAPTGEHATFHGSCQGSILSRPRGDGGFGYDPLFLVRGHDATFAELDPEVKNRISHRAAALHEAAAHLARFSGARR